MRRSRRTSGFTLIEVIATLVIVSVLGTIVYVYFGKGFLESVTPVTRLKQTAALHRVMENITADYNVYPKWRSGTNYTKDISYVIPTYFNGYYYICDISGTSATDEPGWSLINVGTKLNDGTVTWKYGGRVRDLVPLDSLTNSKNLKQQIGAEKSIQSANEYGKNADGTYTTYTVDTNLFIKLNNGIEEKDTEGNNNILKVTLKNDQGETLTALFFSD